MSSVSYILLDFLSQVSLNFYLTISSIYILATIDHNNCSELCVSESKMSLSSKKRKEIALDTLIQKKATTSRAQVKRKQATLPPTSTRYKRRIPEFLKLTSDEDMSDSNESSQYDIEQEDLDHKPLFNLPKRNIKMPQAETKFESKMVSDEDDEMMHELLFRQTKKLIDKSRSEFQRTSTTNKKFGQQQDLLSTSVPSQS